MEDDIFNHNDEPASNDPLVDKSKGNGSLQSKKPNDLQIEINIDKASDDGTKSHNSRLTDDKLEDVSDEGEERGAWGGKLEFIFTCIGYAVGLGNVWRFPYLCYKNGGGAFLIPYVIMLALVGLPLFYMELGFGQFASLGPITIWKINPLFKGLGYSMVAVAWIISVYYNVVISHTLLYLFASFASIPSQLPWIDCDNWWNSDDCIDPVYATAGNGSQVNVTLGNATGDGNYTVVAAAGRVLNHTMNATGKPLTPAEEYYNNYVLEMSSGMDESGGVNWKLALCLLLAWIIVLICLIRGIQSLGKVVYFTALFPYVMLTILLFRGATLPGAIDGIIFYLKPQFDRLLDSRVWSDAATQIFYSLGVCSGGLIVMSSYNKFNNNCYRDALIVSVINCGTSIYAGFVIFSVLGFMAYEKGVPVSEVATGGPGLAFVVYPEAISRMPAPQLWAICFFFMMATLGFGSQFSQVETVLSAFTDEFPEYLRGKYQSIAFRVTVIVLTFLLGLPMVTRGGIYLLNLVDYSVSGFPLLVIGFLELIAINWIYGFYRFAEDLEAMLGKKPGIYWMVCWAIVAPLVIGVTVIFNCIWYTPPSLDKYVYPGWAESLGWCIGLFPILLIPAFFLFRYCRDGGYVLMKLIMTPTEDWGPVEKNEVRFGETVLTPNVVDGVPRFTFPQAMAMASSALSLRGRLGGSTSRIHHAGIRLSPEKAAKPAHHRSHPSIIVNEPSPSASNTGLNEPPAHHRSVSSLKDNIELNDMGGAVQTHV